MSRFAHGLNRFARTLLGMLAGAGIAGYFAYYAVEGERGLMAAQQLQQEIQATAQVLAQVRAERQFYESRVALLRPDSIDPDLLEEQVRLALNFTHPDEVVVLLPHSEALPPAAAAASPTAQAPAAAASTTGTSPSSPSAISATSGR